MKNGLAVGAGVALVVIAAVIYFRDDLRRAGEAVNPLNNDNIFASGFNATGAAISGNSEWTGGGALFDLGHDKDGKSNIFGRFTDWLIM